MQPPPKRQHTDPRPTLLLQWYFDIQCRAILYIYIYIYNFGIFFLVIQIIQWLLFYFGLDSL